jgi:hypothetical protein
VDSFLRVGGITIALRCDDDRILCEWKDPIRRFLVTPATPDISLDVLVGVAPPTDGEVVFDSRSVWRMLHDATGYRIECHSEAFGEEPYKVALFDENFTRGTIVMREEVAHLHPLDYPLDEVLIANLLGRGRGVELHSCGIIDHDGHGHLFVGVSGAGKTTTARLWEGAAAGIVSDDRVIVREEDGVMKMFGTPWHGEAELSIATSVPLTGVYLLTQSDAHKLVDLSTAEAVARLFRCTFPLFHDATAVGFTLEFLERLTKKVPVRELQFTRDKSVVDLVRSTGLPLATDIIIDLLSRGHAVQFRAHGDSMHPLIRSGDLLHVEPNRDAKVGDVVLTLADRGLTAHRVIARNGDLLITRGDNAPSDDSPIDISRVLGRVRVSALRKLGAALVDRFR